MEDDGYFEDKSNAEVCVAFNSQERQKMDPPFIQL